MTEIVFIYPVVAPIPGADPVAVAVPLATRFQVDDELAAALIAAGVALDGADWLDRPPEAYEDGVESQPFGGLPFDPFARP
jgi:hypothetical protein